RPLHPSRPCVIALVFFLMTRRPPSPPLFPYTTLFRSAAAMALEKVWLVITAPTSSPSTAEKASTRPARVRLSQYVRVRRSAATRSEEHTSELQSLTNLVCRLLLEKKKTATDAQPNLHV